MFQDNYHGTNNGYQDVEYVVTDPNEYYPDVTHYPNGAYYPPATPPRFSNYPAAAEPRRSPLFGVRERSINRQIVLGEQIEDNRARLAAVAMDNTSKLVGYEQQLMQQDPAGADYYQALLESFVESSSETIRSFGRPNTNNPFIPNSRNRNYRR